MLHYLLIVLLLVVNEPPRAVPPDARSGTVSGVVHLTRSPPRRIPERYIGAAPAAGRTLQAVPAVVYLRGGPSHNGPAHRPTLLQKDTAFAPGALAVEAGTTVLFPNGDPFFHNVFSYSKPKRFDLGRYPQGEAKAVRFDTPGVVKVYCEVHASMRALVVVTEGPWHAVADAAGRFTIRDVPPGRYELVVVDADLGQHTTTVVVSAGEVTRIRVSLP